VNSRAIKLPYFDQRFSTLSCELPCKISQVMYSGYVEYITLKYSSRTYRRTMCLVSLGHIPRPTKGTIGCWYRPCCCCCRKRRRRRSRSCQVYGKGSMRTRNLLRGEAYHFHQMFRGKTGVLLNVQNRGNHGATAGILVGMHGRNNDPFQPHARGCVSNATKISFFLRSQHPRLRFIGTLATG